MQAYRPGFVDPLSRYIFDDSGNGVIGWGTTVPANGKAGYRPGCLFMDTDAGANATIWVNEGSVTSCTFVAIPTSGQTLAALIVTALTFTTLSDGTTTLAATIAEINRTCKNSNRPVAVGAASLTVTQALHDGKTILLDTATGIAVTLPIMSGSGAKYRFAVTATASGGSYVITATAAHLFGSLLQNNDTAQGTGFQVPAVTNASGSTVITLDGSTKGGRKGDWFEIEDVASGIGMVRGLLNASGTEASPFS